MNSEFYNNYVETNFSRKIIFLIMKKTFKTILEKEYEKKINVIINESFDFEFKLWKILEYKPKIFKPSTIKEDKELDSINYDNLCNNKIKIKNMKKKEIPINIDNSNYFKIIESNLEKPFYKLKNKPIELVKIINKNNSINIDENIIRKNKISWNQIKKPVKAKINETLIKANEKLLKEPHTYNFDGSLLQVKNISKNNFKKIFTQLKINLNLNKEKEEKTNKKNFSSITKNIKNKLVKNLKKLEINTISLNNFNKTEKIINLSNNNKLTINGKIINKKEEKNKVDNNIRKNINKNHLSLLEFEKRKIKAEKENLNKPTGFNNIDINSIKNKKNKKNKPKKYINNVSQIDHSKQKLNTSNISVNYIKNLKNKKIDIKNKNIFEELIN